MEEMEWKMLVSFFLKDLLFKRRNNEVFFKLILKTIFYFLENNGDENVILVVILQNGRESFNWKVFILLVGIVKIERRMMIKNNEI